MRIQLIKLKMKKERGERGKFFNGRGGGTVGVLKKKEYNLC